MTTREHAFDEPASGRRRAHGGAIPMRVLACHPSRRSLARCTTTDGVLATVRTTLVGPVDLGDVVLVHAGVALARLDTEWVP